MSCAGVGACAAVGSYVDDEGMERALVLDTEGSSFSGGGEPGGGGGGGDEHSSGNGSSGGGAGGGSGGGTTPQPQHAGSGSQATVGGGVAKVKGGKALIPLRCPTAGNCSGTLRLTIKVGARGAGKGAGASREAQVLVGKKSFSVPAGAKTVARVPLTKHGKHLVKSSGKRGLKVTLTGTGIKKRTLILKGS
jgi:hypothetical protein